MANTTQRYPLATPDGRAIPLDVVKPVGFLQKAFTTAASGTLTLPSNVEVLSVFASADCYIQFGGTAAVPADGVVVTNLLYVPKNMRITAAPPATTFTVIGKTTSGTLNVQLLEKWAGLILDVQQKRR